MKTTTPFWPLFKNEMRMTSVGNRWGMAVGVLGYWFCAGSFPFAALYGSSNSQADITTMFRTGFLPIFFFLLTVGLTIWTTYVTVPAFTDWMTVPEQSGAGLQNAGGLEYLFTRAVDRRKLFRARAAVFLFIALTPFLLDIAVSCFTPSVDGSPSAYGDDHAKYIRAFPLYHPEAATPDQMVIPHAAIVFSAWLVWLGLLCFLLLLGYGTLIAKRVKAGNLWTLLFPFAPILVVVLVFGLTNHYYKMIEAFAGNTNLFESNFLFFATHPLAMMLGLVALGTAVQIWCEGRFSRLEIL